MKQPVSNRGQLKALHLNLSTPTTRRHLLHETMDALKQRNINCYSCTGLCCTFESNSMQVTPQETMDVFFYLESQNRLTDELKEQLKQTIKQFRLDKEISTGKNSSFRRYYTCTFYVPAEKGCTLSKTDKPYGCLSYNAKEAGAKIQNQCGTDMDLLSQQDKINGDDLMAEKLREELQLSWSKMPLPMALLEFMERF